MSILAGRDHHEDKAVGHPQIKEWHPEGMKGHGITPDAKTEIIIIWANPGGGAKTETINEKVTVTHTVTAEATVTHPAKEPVEHPVQPTEHPIVEEPAKHPAEQPAAEHPVVEEPKHPAVEEPQHPAVTEIKEHETATQPAGGAAHTVTVGGPGGLIFQPEELHEVPIGDTIIFEFLAQNHTVTQSPFDTPCDALEGGMDTGFIANPNNTISPAPQVAMQVMVDTPLWFYCKQGPHCGKGMVFSVNPTAEKTHAMFKALAIKQKGEGAATPITGGDPIAEKPAEEKPAAEKPAEEKPAAEEPKADATVPADAPKNTEYVPGKGQLNQDGSCSCVVACSAGSFPVEAQGVGAFGGQAGALPMKMAGMR